MCCKICYIMKSACLSSLRQLVFTYFQGTMSHRAIDRQASKLTTASTPGSGETKEKKSVARY